MTLSSLLQTLKQIAPMKHVFLIGGIAEVSLLQHEITREHSDLDLLIEIGSWSDLKAELTSIGFTGFEVLFSGPAGQPLAFASNQGSVTVEVWLAKRTGDGYAIILPGDSSTFFQLRLPDDTFDFPQTMLAGGSVQTVSAKALCLFRAASALTRGNAAKRAQDSRVLQQLADTFRLSHEVLIPEITQLRHEPGSY